MQRAASVSTLSERVPRCCALLPYEFYSAGHRDATAPGLIQEDVADEFARLDYTARLTAACCIPLWLAEESGYRGRRPSTIRRNPGTPFSRSPCRLLANRPGRAPDGRAHNTVPNWG